MDEIPPAEDATFGVGIANDVVLELLESSKVKGEGSPLGVRNPKRWVARKEWLWKRHGWGE